MEQISSKVTTVMIWYKTNRRFPSTNVSIDSLEGEVNWSINVVWPFDLEAGSAKTTHTYESCLESTSIIL